MQSQSPQYPLQIPHNFLLYKDLKFSCMYCVSNIYDRVCIDIHDTRYTVHDVFVYRVPNSDVNTEIRCKIIVFNIKSLF